MKTRTTKLQWTLLALATAVAAPAAHAATDAKTIRVLSAAGVDAASPEAAIWRQAPTTRVPLQPAFAGHESVVGSGVTQQISAQAVRTGALLHVRLAWSDRTANTAITDTDRFTDGAAVQFPVNGKPSTVAYMGDAAHAVNVWHWRADGRTQNLVSKGFGTATVVPSEGLTSAFTRTSDGWVVVLTRPLKVRPDEGATLSGKGAMPIGFAAWDGEHAERDGLKAVTLEWWQLRF